MKDVGRPPKDDPDRTRVREALGAHDAVKYVEFHDPPQCRGYGRPRVLLTTIGLGPEERRILQRHLKRQLRDLGTRYQGLSVRDYRLDQEVRGGR